MFQVFVEAFIVGLLTILFGNIAGLITSQIFKIDLPKECEDWNKFYVMEISLFLTGFLVYLFAEFFGIHKWYCKNGFACKR